MGKIIIRVHRPGSENTVLSGKTANTFRLNRCNQHSVIIPLKVLNKSRLETFFDAEGDDFSNLKYLARY